MRKIYACVYIIGMLLSYVFCLSCKWSPLFSECWMAGVSKCCIASSVPDHVRITDVTKHPQLDHGPRFNQYFCFECFQVMLNNQKMDKVFFCNRLAPIMHQETSKRRSVLSCCAIRNPPKWPTFLQFSPSFRRIWIQKTTMKTRVVLRLNWSRWIVGKNMEKLVTDTLKVFHQDLYDHSFEISCTPLSDPSVSSSKLLPMT